MVWEEVGPHGGVLCLGSTGGDLQPPSHELSSLLLSCCHDYVAMWFNGRHLGFAIGQLLI